MLHSRSWQHRCINYTLTGQFHTNTKRKIGKFKPVLLRFCPFIFLVGPTDATIYTRHCAACTIFKQATARLEQSGILLSVGWGLGGVGKKERRGLSRTERYQVEPSQLITNSRDLCPPFSVVMLGGSRILSTAFDFYFGYLYPHDCNSGVKGARNYVTPL